MLIEGSPAACTEEIVVVNTTSRVMHQAHIGWGARNWAILVRVHVVVSSGEACAAPWTWWRALIIRRQTSSTALSQIIIIIVRLVFISTDMQMLPMGLYNIQSPPNTCLQALAMRMNAKLWLPRQSLGTRAVTSSVPILVTAA
jgi:hypothetical protein